MDMWLKATKSWRRKFEPRVRVWKLKEEKTCEEYRCIVRDKVEEAKWKGLGVNDHWQQMKGIMMETAQDISGMTKGSCRHKETWWWNEDVAEAVRENKIIYGKWKKENQSVIVVLCLFISFCAGLTSSILIQSAGSSLTSAVNLWSHSFSSFISFSMYSFQESLIHLSSTITFPDAPLISLTQLYPVFL